MKNKRKHSKGLIVLVTLFVTAFTGMIGTFAWENFGQRAFNATYYEGDDYADIEVEKRIVGEDATLPNAGFVLYRDERASDALDANWQQVTTDIFGTAIGPTFTTGTGGRFSLRHLPVGAYRLVEYHIPLGFGLVAGNRYTYFTITIDSDGELVVLMDDELVDVIPVYNERTNDDLAVDKIVTNVDGSELTYEQRNRLFRFNLELLDGTTAILGPFAYTVYQLYVDYNGHVTGVGTVPLRTGTTSITGSFDLRHGERAVFYGLPVGVIYRVSEVIPDHFNVTASGTEGIIRDQSDADEWLNHATIWNNYRPETTPDDGYLVIEKVLVGEFDPELDPDDIPTCFYFTVIIGEETERVCIVPGYPWTSERFPVGTPFEVVEDDYSHLGMIAVPSRVTGQIVSGQNVVTVTNHIDPDLDGEGDLVVSKRVVGEGYDPYKEFNFTLTLTQIPVVEIPLLDEEGNLVLDEDENPVYELSSTVTIYINGEPRIISAPTWEYAFSLRAGESLDFRNIPAGTQFVIVEEATENFIQGVVSYG